MEPYIYPQGSVISYGWGIENRIGIGILEGSEVNNSTLSNIYNVFDWAGKEIGVNDVPVVFSYEEFVQVKDQTIPVEAEKNGKIEETGESEEINEAKEASETEEINETKEAAEDLQSPVSVPGLRTIFVLSELLILVLIVNRR